MRIVIMCKMTPISVRLNWKNFILISYAVLELLRKVSQGVESAPLPGEIGLMDSNRKFLREHLLSPDRNKRLKIIPCSDLSELKENIEYLHEDLQVLYIHTGVNDSD